MSAQEIKGDGYIIQYDADSVTAKFQGDLALRSAKEYAPIKNLLDEIVSGSPEALEIDLRELTFLNSSGISMLSKFVLGLRKQNIETQLRVLGSNGIAWQRKSLKNLQKFLPSLELEVE